MVWSGIFPLHHPIIPGSPRPISVDRLRQCLAGISRRVLANPDMNLRKKNLLMAIGIGVFALGLYLYAIYSVMSGSSLS